MSKSATHLPALGEGIYTVSDVARALDLPYRKVYRILNSFWEKRVSRHSQQAYAWKVDGSKAVDFLVLIEFYTFFQLRGFGARSEAILDAHEQLCGMFKVAHPFAHRQVLKGLGTNGRKVVFEGPEGILDLDASRQINMDFVRDFMLRLDFGGDDLAERFWPLGQARSVVLDPKRHFGQATIANTGILAEVVAGMVQAGETVSFVAKTYDISEAAVNDALAYAQKAA